MKLVIVDQPTGVIHPGKHTGSIDILVYEFARRAAKAAEVVVYVRRDVGQSYEEVVEGVRYRRFDLSRDARIGRLMTRLTRWRKPTAPWYLSRIYYHSYISAISSELSKEGYDIVHLHSFPQFATAIRAKNPRAKIILNMHCEWLTQLDHAKIAHHLKAVDRIISCSDFITNGVKHHFPYLSDRCRTVPNGADADFFGSITGNRDVQRSKTILYVGRISPEKGLHVLVDAFVRVARNDPDARLDLVGPEAIVPRSFICDLSDEPMVRELGPMCMRGYLDVVRRRIPPEFQDRVRFLGAVPYAEVREYYARACVAVHPSVCQEAFGMPVAEAMMASLPVVVTSAGGMPELVLDGTTGFVVNRNDPRALADAMIMLLQQPELRERMGREGRKRAMAMYTWEKVAEKMLWEYADLYSSRSKAEKAAKDAV